MRNGLVPYGPFTFNGTNFFECSSSVYLGRKTNVMNEFSPELNRRKRTAWVAFESNEDVVKRTKNTQLRSYLFDSTVLSTLTYASETWSLRKQDEKSLSFIEHAVERTTLVSRFSQVKDGIRSSDLRQRSKIKDAVLYAKQLKIMWSGHVLPMNDNRWTTAVSDWISRDLGISNVLQEEHQPNGQSSSRKA
ncbi:unnamed protein product [Angiostrongylus costaricensis]|uniref:Endonuclease-reverse transcriptase n=1 Tax=Angiostrongylus costaricensis TaxID=334426 RepID=A0A0R3PSX4_ANGCS|nr:unnamed protein product [Angiostrongylus costaricensis]